MNVTVGEGFIGAFISAALFGSNFIPVKKYDMGDGMFFQWIMCCAVWMVGIVVNWVQGFPKFYALAMLGGAMWATGNVCVVPIIKTLGLGLGFLIWATFNMFSGWFSGRFGMFGLTPQVPENIPLNWAGFFTCAASVFVYFCIKPTLDNPSQTSMPPQYSESDPLVSETCDSATVNSMLNESVLTNSTHLDRLSLVQQRIVGIALSVFAGTLFGLSFTPIIHIQDNYKDASKVGLDYVFAHFTGIFAFSTLYFVLYCVVKCNRPLLLPPIVLPSMVSGIMWAIAETAWFVANDGLSEPVSFPIITAVPGALNALWGVLVFKEIRGKRNFIFLIVAFAFTTAGVVMTAISKGS